MKFELKKIINKITVISMILMVSIIIFHAFLELGQWESTFVNKNKIITGKLSYRTFKNQSKKFEGVIDEKYLNDFMKVYKKSKTVKYLEDSNSMDWNEYYLPKYFINTVISEESGNPIRKLDIDSVYLNNEEDFYNKFKENITKNIDEENEIYGFKKYDANQINIIKTKIRNIKIPFKIAYTEGLSNVTRFFKIDYIFFAIVIIFALSGLFTKDSNIGIDELSLSSKTGKSNNMKNRLFAGNIFVILMYFVYIFTLLFIHGSIATLHGLKASLQIYNMNSLLNIDMLRMLVMVFAGGLCGALIIGNLTMLIGLYSKNMKITLLVTMLLFLYNYNLNNTRNPIKQLFPLNFSNYNTLTSLGAYYFIGNTPTHYFYIILILSIIYLSIIYILMKLKFKKYYI